MKHFLIVTLAGVVTLTIVLAIYRVDILEDIWLWIVGLIGPIIGTIQRVSQKVLSLINKTEVKS
ncbi:MAG: hypothetical protein AAF616_05205 [Bacteroidota bacterium]